MLFTTSTTQGTTIFSLSGRFTFHDNDAFQPVLSSIAAASGQIFVIDLSDLDYVDSFGIGLFIVAHDEAAKAGNSVVFTNPAGLVDKLFHDLNLKFVLSVAACKGTGTVDALAVSAPVKSGGSTRMTLSGRFTGRAQATFLPVLEAIEAHDGEEFVLDLAGLEFIDGIALSTLLIAADEARRNHVPLVFQSPSDNLRHLFKLSAVDTLVTIR